MNNYLGLFLFAVTVLLPVAGQSQCNALNFDGEDDYVEIPSPFSGDSDFTVEMWFKTDNTSTGICQNSNISNFRWLVSWDDSQFGIGDCNGDLRFVFRPLCPIGTGLCSSLPVTPINDGFWHHVAYTKGPTGTRIYVDGAFFVNFAAAPYDLSGFFRLGSSGSGNSGRNWQGGIDEVRIWNYARTEEEILSSVTCQLNGNEAGLVAYYTLNQGLAQGNNLAVTSLFDQTSGSLTGTLNNFALDGGASNWVSSADESLCSACTVTSDCGPQISVTNAEVCSPLFSYENPSTDQIHGVAFRINGAEFNNDDIFWSMELERPSFSPDYMLLAAPDQLELPILMSDFVGLHFQNIITSPLELIVEYRDSSLEVTICSDTLLLNCPVPNYCLEVATDTLICSNPDPGYRLQINVVVPNDNYTDDVGRVKIAVPGLAPIIYDFIPALTSGESFGIDTLLTDIGLLAGDTLKVLVTAHDGPDERLCCFADSLCLEIPFCEDPCEDLDALLIVEPIESRLGECCYDLLFVNNADDPDYFDSLRIETFFNGTAPLIPTEIDPISNMIWSYEPAVSGPGNLIFSGATPSNGGNPEPIVRICYPQQETPYSVAFLPFLGNATLEVECELGPVLVSCDPLPAACDSISVTLTPTGEDSCCYYLIYENSLPEGTIDSVQINLFDGPSYAQENFITTNNFAFSTLRSDGRESLTLGPFPIFNTPISPGIDTLLEFCLDPAQPLDSTRIEVNSFLNGDVMEPCRDTLAALCPAPDPCDSLAAYILPAEEPCCYNVFLDNTYSTEPDLLESVTVNLINGPVDSFNGLSRIPTAPGWGLASVNEERRRFTLNPTGDTLPRGLGQQVFQFCVAESFSTDSTYVEIAWQTATDTICADTVAAICQNCMSIEEEELGCDDGQPTYAFTFTNYSEIPGNTIRIIYTEGVPEGIEMPQTITLTEMVGPGETYSGTILFDLNNDLEGEEVCFDIILEQVLPNQVPIRCCYVTHCVLSLDCGPGSFAPGDGGEVAIQAYPNPASGEVMLLSDQLGVAKVALLSFTGQEAGSQTIDFSGLPMSLVLRNHPPGVYTVLVQFADGRRGVRRIVIK